MVKERLQGVVAGVLIGALMTGGAVFAKSALESIEVEYDNIKVYKDNVLCELKDANGSVIEPFIYNGTTYMPVRGTASLADMQVTWDGANKSVHLWENMVPEGTSFMEVCPPYELRCFQEYIATEGKSFTMAGQKYSNGIVSPSSWDTERVALFNLDSKYSSLECTIGHSELEGYAKSVSFLVDGKIVETIELEPDCLPKKVNVSLQYGLQLKIIVNEVPDGKMSGIGIGNITVR